MSTDDITTRMQNLGNSELHDLASALRFWCPNIECSKCPMYTGFIDAFPLIPCFCIQCDLELQTRERSKHD